MSAAQIGAVALITTIVPASSACDAYANKVKGMADINNPIKKIAHGAFLICSITFEEIMSGTSTKAAILTLRKMRGIAPNWGAAIRKQINEPPQRAARANSSAIDLFAIAHQTSWSGMKVIKSVVPTSTPA